MKISEKKREKKSPDFKTINYSIYIYHDENRQKTGSKHARKHTYALKLTKPNPNRYTMSMAGLYVNILWVGLKISNQFYWSKLQNRL